MKNMQLAHDEHAPNLRRYPLCYLAHDIDVPMNIGSLFRIADAMGVEKIYLTGTSAVPPNAKIRKTSRSTEKFVEYSYEGDPKEVVVGLKCEGYRIISLEISTQSIDIKSFSVSSYDKICLILGSESRGVCQELLDMSDVSVHIPMLGVNSSMNVANACAIATYTIINGLDNRP